MPAPRVPGARPRQRRATRSWRRFTETTRPTDCGRWTHPSFLRSERLGMIVAKTGSVSLSYDGAAYLLVDESKPTIRRLEYDVEKELKALASCDLPHADWIARILDSARPQMPQGETAKPPYSRRDAGAMVGRRRLTLRPAGRRLWTLLWPLGVRLDLIWR